MQAIPTAGLRIRGSIGFDRILDFTMEETPGMHARAFVSGTTQLRADGRWVIEEPVAGSVVELYQEGSNTLLYSGILQCAEAKEENGVHFLRLELQSASILLDLEKKSRSFQDAKMTYGQMFSQVAAAAGAKVIYPEELDARPIGFPVIQYRETDWMFLRRLASRFGYALYPDPSSGAVRCYVGLPPSEQEIEIETSSYCACLDRRFFDRGGWAAGLERGQFLSWTVTDQERYPVGSWVTFQGRSLLICARTCQTRQGQLEFSYTLAGPQWAGERQLSNDQVCGMSLLGTVLSCAGEQVRLELDIDAEAKHPQPAAYPWRWVPATGNVMYMMPQPGSRVSLYFPDAEEAHAIAVNCIRSGGGCQGLDYRDKQLTTEHGMQLRLCQEELGVVTLKNRVLLDNLSGIRMEGGSFHLLAGGTVKIDGSMVTLSGAQGVSACRGVITPSAGGGAEVVARAKVELSSGEGEEAIHARGEGITYYLAWKREDLSDPAYRYRDEPQQKDYDWGELFSHVSGSMVVVAGAAALAATGVGALGGSAVAAGTMGGSVMITGSMYVGTQAARDALGGRVSSADTYIRQAMAGSVVGMMTGASSLAAAGAGLGKTMSIAFAEGAAGSAASQQILTGEIHWEEAIADGVFSGILEGAMLGWRRAAGQRSGSVLEDSGFEGPGKIELNDPIKVKTNKGIEVEFTNPTGNTIKYVEQNPKNIPHAIESAQNSSNAGKAIEGKVGSFVQQKTDVTGFGQEVLSTSGGKVTDLDVVTNHQIIEVKKSAAALKIDQIDRLVDSTNPQFFNFDNKEVIVYIEESIEGITNPHTLEKIKYIQEKGVKIVNSLDELEGVLK